MFFWGKAQRKYRRYPVAWHGILTVRNAFSGHQIPVVLQNVSAIGAHLHAESITAFMQSLLQTRQPPEVMLQFETPAGPVEALVEIRWYRWSYQINLFEVGIHFEGLSNNGRKVLKTMLTRLEPAHTAEALHS